MRSISRRSVMSLKVTTMPLVSPLSSWIGVLLNSTGPRSLRAVTHLDLTAADVERAAQRLCDAIISLRGSAT